MTDEQDLLNELPTVTEELEPTTQQETEPLTEPEQPKLVTNMDELKDYFSKFATEQDAKRHLIKNLNENRFHTPTGKSYPRSSAYRAIAKLKDNGIFKTHTKNKYKDLTIKFDAPPLPPKQPDTETEELEPTTQENEPETEQPQEQDTYSLEQETLSQGDGFNPTDNFNPSEEERKRDCELMFKWNIKYATKTTVLGLKPVTLEGEELTAVLTATKYVTKGKLADPNTLAWGVLVQAGLAIGFAKLPEDTQTKITKGVESLAEKLFNMLGNLGGGSK